MFIVAVPFSFMSAATRARVLKGSIAYLLEELIETCSEEGMPCSGTSREQLFSEIDELAYYFRVYPDETECLTEGPTILARMIEKLEGPEISAAQLSQIQRDFHQLIHPTKKS